MHVLEIRVRAASLLHQPTEKSCRDTNRQRDQKPTLLSRQYCVLNGDSFVGENRSQLRRDGRPGGRIHR
jgi:hypothetical protein